MKSSSDLTNKTRIEASKLGYRLFRNNVGMFYTENGTPVMCGLCKGSSDLIGWREIIVTSDMVGKRMAVFTAFEIKSGKDRLKEEQKTFLNAVGKAGGIISVVRDEQDVHAIDSKACPV